MTTDLLISVAIIAALIFGYLFGKNRNKARMTKLASSNIDLIELVESQSRLANSHYELENAMRIENEALKFQIQQFNIAKDQMKFTDQG